MKVLVLTRGDLAPRPFGGNPCCKAWLRGEKSAEVVVPLRHDGEGRTEHFQEEVTR